MSDRDTAILLTPPGGAAIAVLRLSGPGVARFLAAHFSRPAAPGRCVHATLSDGGRIIDDPVVVLRADGLAADVNLHGGPWVVRSALELARKEGFDVKQRIELPLPGDAVDAETEVGREVLRYLPMARTELALRVLLAQERAWQRANRDEAGVGAMLNDRSLYWLLHPPRVAIVGVPNVGKSTLANQLFAQERSITADLPGTTRDWVGEIANIDGLAVMLVDTPGLRETDDAVEREAIARARGEVALADLVVLILDPTQEPERQHELMTVHADALLVVNKSDQPATWDVPAGRPVIRTVATAGAGVDLLRQAIQRTFLGTDGGAINRARWWTDRQRRVLERTLVDPETDWGI